MYKVALYHCIILAAMVTDLYGFKDALETQHVYGNIRGQRPKQDQVHMCRKVYYIIITQLIYITAWA